MDLEKSGGGGKVRDEGGYGNGGILGGNGGGTGSDRGEGGGGEEVLWGVVNGGKVAVPASMDRIRRMRMRMFLGQGLRL